MQKQRMPVGNTNFAEIRENGFYYIDKTNLIDHIINDINAKVTLITRPRRFGKTLNMSMLNCFFDIRKDSSPIFEGLAIMENKELCSEWMNRYPTIYLSFKEVGGITFDLAYGRLKALLQALYREYYFLTENLKDEDNIKMQFKRICSDQITETDISCSLKLLSQLMYEYYQKPIVLLIDEYDVPMAKGSSNGYYREITDVMRYMLSNALKDNPYLRLSVMTGCLRIAKESIFTGVNHLYVDSVGSIGLDEYFGFTDREMDKLLSDTDLIEYKQVFKSWYDGYRFGDKDIYCPWDVLNYVSDLQKKPGIAPKNYWTNTSGNEIIKEYLDSGMDLSDDIETLIGGGYIEKIINEDITYEDLTSTEENFWSVLLMTGYLTSVSGEKYVRLMEKGQYYYERNEEPKTKLRLVNNEIRELFAGTVAVWFNENIVKDERTELFNAIWSGNDEALSEIISDYLYQTISYFDYNENYYHAFLTGLLSGVKHCSVSSNLEAGLGRADIIIKNKPNRRVAIFEVKRAKNEDEMPKLCDEALRQIDEKKYYKPYKRETVLKYGVTFFEKDCLVKRA